MKMLYEGKAKQVFETEKEDEICIHYKDDATAFNGLKKDSIQNKGIMNNKITTLIYEYLISKNIPTHYIETLNERDQRCVKVDIIPLEVIVRNIIAGSCAKHLGLEEGIKPEEVIIEICYKKDELGDPMINDSHAIALKLVTRKELDIIYSLTKKINVALIELFNEISIDLIDFKIEFGKDKNGTILLADEISPDTCRLWDSKTQEKLDKDRFRRDLGRVEEAYLEILQRLDKRERN
ncbi:MAG: phosphoribosylaminoimidazolesuccinocarboxamide synthase [Erysipelotrichaceae bacterium]